jgi:hypothetical protein
LAAPPEFVVLTAPFIKELTGLVKKAWNLHSKIVYAPGRSSRELAECIEARNSINHANEDFVGYDSSQDSSFANGEVSICKQYGAPCATIQLMGKNGKFTHGVSREGIKFQCDYIRNSGDPWTTLFNTIWNGALNAYAFCMDRGCDPKQMDALICVGGDDSSTHYDGEPIDFNHYMSALGMPVEVKHVQSCDIEFLSCRLVHTSTGPNFVPKVGQTIAKLGYSVRANPKNALSIARGAAMSMQFAASGCPPLNSYIQTILRLTEEVKEERPRDEPWKMSAGHTGYATPETWAELWEVYAWSIELQEQLDAQLDSLTELGLIIESPALQMLIDIDYGRISPEFCRPKVASDPTCVWVVSDDQIPDAPLVGIEPNPGPGRRNKGAKKNKSARRPRSVSAGIQQGVKKTYVAPTGADVGSMLGGFLGDMAQRAIETVTGMGDYQVKANSLFSGSVDSNGPPQFLSSSGRGSTRIIHREYIGDVSSIGATFNTPYILQINPTNSSTFPWLSNIAGNYETYKFHGLVYEFKTSSGTSVASTNTALGVVIIATQYNIDDPSFINKSQMEQYQFAVSCVPFQSMIHPVECARGAGALDYLYTYQGGSGDPRFTNMGNVTVATVGQQAAANLGELWVSYDIELAMPRLPQVGEAYIYHASIANSSGYGGTIATSIFTTNAGTSFSLGSNNTLAVTLSTTSDTINFAYNEVGSYLVTIYIQGSSTGTFTVTTPTFNGGAVALNLFPTSGGVVDGVAYSWAPNTAATTSLIMLQCSFTIPAGLSSTAVPGVTFNVTSGPATLIACNVFVNQIYLTN